MLLEEMPQLHGLEVDGAARGEKKEEERGVHEGGGHSCLP